MGDTSIQWTDKTWNPVTGCSKVSHGCKFCYAERVFPRAYHDTCRDCGHSANAHNASGCRLVRLESGECNCLQFIQRKFTDVRCHFERLGQPLHWKRPCRIFVNSMSDLFHKDVPFEFIDRVFAVMAAETGHQFQILTKRADRMREYISSHDGVRHIAEAQRMKNWPAKLKIQIQWPLPNVWLGVSCEDQPTADERIVRLLQTPAAVRFVSYEPALSEVNFRKLHIREDLYVDAFTGAHEAMAYGNNIPLPPILPALDWVIIGGESGSKARPFNIEWVRSAIRQRGVLPTRIFVKQVGAKPWDPWRGKADHLFVPCGHACDCCDECPTNDGQISAELHPPILIVKDSHGGDWSEWDEDLRVREFPDTSRSGRALR